MSDHYMPQLRLPLTREQFHRLPRNTAYKYEFLAGEAVLSPRPKHYHAVLDLRPITAAADCELVPIDESHRDGLVPLFAAAFRQIQPFGSLDDDERLTAARRALERTWTDGDGPWVRQASFVARQDERLLGSIWVTLLPLGDHCEWDSYYWDGPPPDRCIELRLGRAHLTWVFVSPFDAGHGVGTALLAAAVRELLALGYTELVSTFMQGNDSSLLWHWRNGFRLLPHPGSFRRIRQQWGLGFGRLG